MRRPSYLVLLTSVVLALFAGCSKKYPYGKPPDCFFQDAPVLALCASILEDDLPRVMQVIKDGANLNLKGKDGITPLLWALGTKNKEVFELLLASGADPNIQTSKGASVMGYVAAMSDASFLKAVLKHGGNPNLVDTDTLDTPIIEAIMHNQFENMKILIEHGANVNYAEPMGHTVVMDAAALNRYDMVLFLLSAGADYRKATKKGDTLIDLLRADLKNPNLLRTGKLFEAKAQVIDLLESNGVNVVELRDLYRTPPGNSLPQTREPRGQTLKDKKELR